MRAITTIALLMGAMNLEANPPQIPLSVSLAIEFYHEIQSSQEPEHAIGCAIEIAGLAALGLPIDCVDCDEIADWYWAAVQETGDPDLVLWAMSFAIRIHYWLTG